mmetsp:Transcript_2783/g.5924  ORF Transcript_2783/g.5924 Transcript_2783/m.5924 type:complete len:168 (+) Transcript_2783:148-651(+)
MKFNSMTFTLAATIATFGVASAANNPCLTQEACDAARQEMGIETFYIDELTLYIDEFPTKGCFGKNDKAFFSIGTEDEMSVDELPGVQERIWCDGGDSNDSINLFDVDAADSTTNAAAGSNTKVAGDSNYLLNIAAAGSSDSGATVGMISFSLGVTVAAVMAASRIF